MSHKSRIYLSKQNTFPPTEFPQRKAWFLPHSGSQPLYIEYTENIQYNYFYTNRGHLTISKIEDTRNPLSERFWINSLILHNLLQISTSSLFNIPFFVFSSFPNFNVVIFAITRRSRRWKRERRDVNAGIENAAIPSNRARYLAVACIFSVRVYRRRVCGGLQTGWAGLRDELRPLGRRASCTTKIPTDILLRIIAPVRLFIPI